MKIYENICPEEKCTGCMACMNACSHDSIKVIEDKLGFKFPKIEKNKCIECGLCKSVCPELHPRTFRYPNKCFAAISKDFSQLMSCASGGIATQLGKVVLESGGKIVGCSGEDINNVRHILIDKIADVNKLSGSKYVQSDISSKLFRDIRETLLTGQKVLFIGTGCQIAGLQNFLRKKYPNLLTVDLVCHGVPSQKLLSDDLELYRSTSLKSIRFRRKVFLSKKKSPQESKCQIQYGLSVGNNERRSNENFIKYYKDPYMGSFLDSLIFRDSCYRCQYAQPNRQSDITLCDFWGLHDDSILYDSPGPSAILINSENGECWFDKIKDDLIYEQRNVEEAIMGNGQLQHPSPMNPKRQEFINIYNEEGIKKAYYKTIYRRVLFNYYINQLKSRLKTYSFIVRLYKFIKDQ